MKKIVVFGNSGSGKTTLANRLCQAEGLAHLDLDNVAWKPVSPPERREIADARQEIDEFMRAHAEWVIEGCYSDLLELVLPKASEIVFLNLPIEACIANAKRRPWEPHKYETRELQDANLDMLLEWIAQYQVRTDTFSKTFHEALYNRYSGKKTMYTSNNCSG